MLNLFLGFSGRLRRREFILWSIIVPLALVVPPALAVATTAQSLETSLTEDLAASGMAWPFLILVLIASYVSVALFWKRIQDVDDATLSGLTSSVMRWGYAVLTALNSLVVGLNLVALGQIEGSFAGVVVMGFWSMACRLKPQSGPNRFGPDPRIGGATGRGDSDEGSAQSALLDAAMQRAVAERAGQSSAVLSPKLARPAMRPAAPSGKPSFGKRT